MTVSVYYLYKRLVKNESSFDHNNIHIGYRGFLLYTLRAPFADDQLSEKAYIRGSRGIRKDGWKLGLL